jgi:hypothetical protein
MSLQMMPSQATISLTHITTRVKDWDDRESARSSHFYSSIVFLNIKSAHPL